MNTKYSSAILAILLLLGTLAVAAPAQAASGSISISTTRFTILNAGKSTAHMEKTTVVLNGGTFTSGATVQIYISPDTTFNASDKQIGQVTLPAGQTSFVNTVTTLGGSGYTLDSWDAGTYYIAATDGNGWTSPVKVELTTQNPEITLKDAEGNNITASNPASPGETITIEGEGFTAATSVTIYLERPGGQVLATVTTESDGTFSVDITVPNLAKGDYNVIAQQADTLQDEATLYIGPRIEVEPFVVGTATGQVITVRGYGFTAGAKISANSITVDSASTTHPEVTIADDGTFTVTATITTTLTTGWKTVNVTSDAPETATANLLVSKPGFTESSISLSGGTTSKDVNVGDSVRIYVWNYPANIALKVMMGSVELGTLTTNSLGAGYLDAKIPELPGSAAGVGYVVDAVNTDQGIVAVHTLTLTVKTSLKLELQDSFVTTSGVAAKIYGYGAAPLETLTISFTNGNVTSSVTEVETDASGSFSVTVELTAKKDSTVKTGNTDTVQVSGTRTGTVTGPGVTIWRDDLASISLSPDNALTGSSIIVTASNLRPSTSYEVLFGGNSLSPQLTFTTTSSGSGTVTLTVPSVAQNPYKVSVVVSGTTTEDAYSYLVVSSPGTVPSFLARAPGATPSSTLNVKPGDKIELYVYGFSNSESVSVYRVGISTPINSTTLGSSGGALLTWTVPTIAPGTYRLYVTGSIAGTIDKYVYVTIGPVVTFNRTSGPIGTPVSIDGKGLPPSTAFNVIFGEKDLGYVGTSDSSGVLSTSFTVPTVAEGTYTVKLVSPDGSVVASESFEVTIPSALTITPDPKAFPTELVTFKWNTGALTAPVSITVMLDDYPITASAYYASNYIYGSFEVPNAEAGTVFKLTISYVDNASLTGTVTAPLEIVEGRGALLTGLTSDQESLLAKVNTNVGTVLVRLDDLNATITSVKDGVATLDTKFGEMKASLDAIDAKVASIKDNVAEISTTLGTVTAKLDDVASAIASAKDEVISSVSNAKEDLAGSISEVKGSLTGLSGVVSDIKGATNKLNSAVTGLSGTLSGIKSDVSAVKSGVESVKADTAGLAQISTFVIVAAVLAAITVVLEIVVLARKK